MRKVDEEYSGLGFDPDNLTEKSREEGVKRLWMDVNDKYEGSTL